MVRFPLRMISSNIVQARIQGLEDDLKMKGNQFNIALLVFFIPYVLFEVPSNIILRKVAPSTWLSVIMGCWGRCHVTESIVTLANVHQKAS